MYLLSVTVKDRAFFPCFITNANHVIKRLTFNSVKRFRPLIANVDTEVIHRPNRIRVDLCSMASRALDFNPTAADMT